MNKRIGLIIFSIIIFLIIIVIMYFSKNNKIEKNLDETYETLKKDLIIYDENVNIDELKQEYNITGATELYEIQTEYDGRKVLSIKSELNYKVAFVGLITNRKPDFTDITQTFEQKHPTEKGIWIENESREKILNYLNNTLKSTYTINREGYLCVSDLQKSEEDDMINLLINGDKQYIIGINSVIYYIDPLTGEIIDNPYEEFDYAQTYSYVEDANKIMIFVTENKNHYLSNEDIFESIIKLLKYRL